ncbi:putative ATP-dependent RNA helicase TDRD12 [Prorops nasuta]|uniref:putative ATP-dependent RNA helicase TDRD12 n=1 Tax=Prorops nasuta TaxID=863751 RepID=UPI0034CE0F41
MEFAGPGCNIPLTAVAVHITNIITLYDMKMYEIKDYTEKLDIISLELMQLWTSGFLQKYKDKKQLKLGDYLVVNKNSNNIEEPPCWVRGQLGRKNYQGNYEIFLNDYGTVIICGIEDFIVVPNDLLSRKFLTQTIGLYNILPARLEFDIGSFIENVIFVEYWTESSIQFTKEILTSATDIYFDYQAYGEEEKKYGELYLYINNKAVSLSKLLISNCHAIYLEEPKLLNNAGSDIDSILSTETEEGSVNRLLNNQTNQLQKDIVKNESTTEDANSSFGEQNISVKKKSLHPEEDKFNKVLVYGYNNYECLSSVSEARFPKEVHKAWLFHTNSNRPKRIQSYMWPAIREKLDVIAIGAKNSGKTYGYTFGIAGTIATLDITNSRKPAALILCSTSIEVFDVKGLCEAFLQNYDIKCVAAYNGKSDKSLAAEICNGCQVLISTPEYLMRFLKTTKDFLHLDELNHIILDSANVILEKYFITTMRLLKKCNVIKVKDKEEKKKQFIVVSRHWTKLLKRFVNEVMTDPFICISSYLEAMIYKSIRPKLYITSSEKKKEKLLGLLSEEERLFKTVICCTNMVEATELNDFLSSRKQTVLAHEKMNFLNLNAQRNQWKTFNAELYTILICTDDILSSINITNADWLIHYSIDLSLKSQFNYRFSTLLEILRRDNPNCKITIFADEKNDKQFLSVVRLMERIGTAFPLIMKKSIDRIAITLDQEKREYQLCDNVKSLGFCPYNNTCNYRHCVLSEVDKPITDIQINDIVKLKVIQLHDASHFSARIIEYTKLETSKTISFSQTEFINISTRMQKYYTMISNRKRAEFVKVGKIYTIEESVDNYKRVQVLHLCEKYLNYLNDSPMALVRCIDSGNVLKIDARSLMEIPEDLLKLPIHVVEIFMDNIVPFDNEYIWNRCANDSAYQWFNDNLDKHSYVTGMVSLHLGNTIWLRNLECKTKIIGYSDLARSELKAYLTKEGHAIKDEDHIRKLYKLCENARLTKINGCDVDNLMNPKSMTIVQ